MTRLVLISAMPFSIRSLSSAQEATRICLRNVRLILENRFSTRLSQAPCLGVCTYSNRLGRVPDRFVSPEKHEPNGGATQSNRSSNRLQGKSVCIGQKNAGSLRFPNRGHPGSGHSLEALSLFCRENQRIPFGFVGHTTSGEKGDEQV